MQPLILTIKTKKRTSFAQKWKVTSFWTVKSTGLQNGSNDFSHKERNLEYWCKENFRVFQGDFWIYLT